MSTINSCAYIYPLKHKKAGTKCSYKTKHDNFCGLHSDDKTKKEIKPKEVKPKEVKEIKPKEVKSIKVKEVIPKKININPYNIEIEDEDYIMLSEIIKFKKNIVDADEDADSDVDSDANSDADENSDANSDVESDANADAKSSADSDVEAESKLEKYLGDDKDYEEIDYGFEDTDKNKYIEEYDDTICSYIFPNKHKKANQRCNNQIINDASNLCKTHIKHL